MWSRNGRGTKLRIPKSIYNDGIVDKELKDLLQNKSGCSDDLKMSISREEIIAAIRSIEEGKAPTPDEVSTSFLLGCEQEMLIPLLIIFNKSYDEGKISEMCKCDSGNKKGFKL